MRYNVLQQYEATVTQVDNPYHFKQHQLFDMALRINKKRRFLFVSQVLGKHLAVDPNIPLLTSHLLAYLFMEQRYGYVDEFAQKVSRAIQMKQNLLNVLTASRAQKLTPPSAVLIIGFAETATALGHGFFEKFAGDVQFVHTTREHLVNVEPVICFEEEHSHASSHRLYAEETFFLRETEVVLVDDEMTSGKTNRNIIRQLHEKYPHLTTFTLVSILDFRTAQARDEMQQLAHELGITIHSVSLFTGAFQIEETGELQMEEMGAHKNEANGPLHTEIVPAMPQHRARLEYSLERLLQDALMEQASYCEAQYVKYANYYQDSGRFGLSVDGQQRLEKHVAQVAELLQKRRSQGRCLVLGTGEFMYVPMSIALHMGDDVSYHATTRSPIYAHEQSLIYNKFTFPSADFPGVTNYLYNIPANYYTDIFVVYERIMDSEAAAILQEQLQPYAQHIHFVTLGGVEHAVYA